MARIYLSTDDMARRLARRWATVDIYQHPREIVGLQRGDLLVIDFDHVLFDDKDAAVALMLRSVRQGVRVGVHTYADGDPRLYPVLAHPAVVVAKRQRDVLTTLARQARERRRAA